MKNWGALIQALAAFITLLVNRSTQIAERTLQLEARQMGRTEALTEALQDAINTIKHANAARQEFRDRHRLDPSGLREDDEYRRDETQPNARDPTG